MTGEMKHCTKCKELLPLSSFGKKTGSPDNLQYWCKTCINKNGQEGYIRNKGNRWEDRNPEKKREVQRRAQLKHRYNLTDEQYAEMLAKQNGHCALCDSTKRLCIDHDHKTGEVRGILCTGCNVFLGKLEALTEEEVKARLTYIGHCWHIAAAIERNDW